MTNKGNDKEINPLEEQIKEIDEWQKNASNPCHYVGSGKVPAPLKNMFKSPAVMLVVGLIISEPVIYGIITDFTFNNIVSNAMPILLCGILIAGGTIRILKKH
jgi:hypothetical protein